MRQVRQGGHDPRGERVEDAGEAVALPALGEDVEHGAQPPGMPQVPG